MNYYYIIPGALLITFIITLVIALFTKRPLRGLWLFFFIVFLASWAGQLWITPFGPLYLGIAWFPLLITALLFWFLILALIPPIAPAVPENNAGEKQSAVAAFGAFFWIMLTLLIISVIAGYYRIW
jgi:hypothetical protein